MIWGTNIKSTKMWETNMKTSLTWAISTKKFSNSKCKSGPYVNLFALNREYWLLRSNIKLLNMKCWENIKHYQTPDSIRYPQITSILLKASYRIQCHHMWTITSSVGYRLNQRNKYHGQQQLHLGSWKWKIRMCKASINLHSVLLLSSPLTCGSHLNCQ